MVVNNLIRTLLFRLTGRDNSEILDTGFLGCERGGSRSNSCVPSVVSRISTVGRHRLGEVSVVCTCVSSRSSS